MIGAFPEGAKGRVKAQVHQRSALETVPGTESDILPNAPAGSNEQMEDRPEEHPLGLDSRKTRVNRRMGNFPCAPADVDCGNEFRIKPAAQRPGRWEKY